MAVLVRLQFARVPSSRCLLLRLALFLLVSAVAFSIGDWIDLHHYVSASSWFDLGWASLVLVASLVAITWTPALEPEFKPEPANFLSFLGTNLALVAMLCGINLLNDRWEQAYGTILADISIATSLLAFSIRLALTQFHQQQEIARRKAAQNQLTISNQQVVCLLQDARRQTAEIAQISELGSLLHACASREEVFRLIPERLRRLFPASSGCLALTSSSRIRFESVVEWGVPPADQIFSPEECWALRRGSVQAQAAGHSTTRCPHLLGHGASVCIPLIANGEAIGTLAIQNDDPVLPASGDDAEPDSDSGVFARQQQLATAVAQRVALCIANLNLREALRLQAIRDPLTGLYNRRYMQEFLDRELHTARRKHRPLTVMMLDLDHFKRYNDTWGHSAGDKALTAVGETLLRSIRADDIACRYGGEEFTIILPECNLDQGTMRAEEIRKRLRDLPLAGSGQPSDPITVSIGVAAFDETTGRVDLLVKFADDALYQAKRAGRDRVVAANPAVSPDFESESDGNGKPKTGAASASSA